MHHIAEGDLKYRRQAIRRKPNQVDSNKPAQKQAKELGVEDIGEKKLGAAQGQEHSSTFGTTPKTIFPDDIRERAKPSP